MEVYEDSTLGPRRQRPRQEPEFAKSTVIIDCYPNLVGIDPARIIAYDHDYGEIRVTELLEGAVDMIKVVEQVTR